MRKALLFPALLLFVACSTKSPEQQANKPQPEVVKPGYNVRMVNDYQTILNALDSLKPSLSQSLTDDYQWILTLSEKEKEEHKQDLNAVRVNLAVEAYYSFLTRLEKDCQEIKVAAIGTYQNGKSFEENQALEKEFIEKNDTAFVCSGTKEKLKEIKDRFVERFK